MSDKTSKETAMDQLFSGLSNPNPPSQGSTEPATSSAQPSASTRKNKKVEDERVCTIMNVETMNKLRSINGKEGIPLRELFDIAAKYLINAYEAKYGVIRVHKSRPKSGDARKIFDI